MTDVELELITDRDIYLMIESAIRGGLSYVAQRRAALRPRQLSGDVRLSFRPADVAPALPQLQLSVNDLSDVSATGRQIPLSDRRGTADVRRCRHAGRFTDGLLCRV